MQNLSTLCATCACLALCLPGAAVAEATLPVVTVTPGPEALSVPSTPQATQDLRRIPGAAEVVPDTAFKAGPAQTVKDVLGAVPGVVTQNRWGPDARISIRGSGLSRNYGNRGVNLFIDGIPVNTADGLFDLFEIDPTAYRHVEVYKGANALRYGANALGGAVNFVTPSGRDAERLDARLDAGSFGYRRAQASTGGADGALDYFITGSAERWDGYRAHSQGRQQRVSANVGYRAFADAETRFYLNASTWRSRLPGELTRDPALETPRTANGFFSLVDQQRNIDALRVAAKTTLRFGAATVEAGVFGTRRHVMHPIYQWLDYRVDDYGGFLRATDDRQVNGYRHRVVAGLQLHNGAIDNRQFVNLPGAVKGPLVASNVDRSRNLSAYVEDAFFVRPDLALIAGAQFHHAVRQRRDRFLSDGDASGGRSHDSFSPRLGILWDVDPQWQVFANVSRSAEAPTFDVNSFASAASSAADAQTGTTFEIGTRGRRRDLHWDIAVYRAEIRKELQCLGDPATPGACTVTNAGRTVHQGIEAGIGFALWRSMLRAGDRVGFNAAYSYNGLFFRGDARYGNKRLPGVPPHLLRAELVYRHPAGFHAGPGVEWVPRRYFADNANTLAIAPHTVWNLRLGFEDARSGWSAYLEARNLLDRRYIASTVVVETANAASALFHPGTGRSLHGGLRYTW